MVLGERMVKIGTKKTAATRGNGERDGRTRRKDRDLKQKILSVNMSTQEKFPVSSQARSSSNPANNDHPSLHYNVVKVFLILNPIVAVQLIHQTSKGNVLSMHL